MTESWRPWRRKRPVIIQPHALPEAEARLQPLTNTMPDGFLFDGAYSTNREHLFDELTWIDIYVRAQVLRWHDALGMHRPEDDWGSPKISEAEISAYLLSRFNLPFVADELRADTSLQALMDQASRWRRHIDKRLSNTPVEEDLRLLRLRTLYSLGDFEVSLLLVCLLGEVDWRYRNLYSYMQDEQYRTQPSVALALDMLPFGQSAEKLAAFATSEPLLRRQLITLTTDSRATQLAMNSIGIDRRILHFLLDDDTLDSALDSVLRRESTAVGWAQLFLDDERLRALREMADEWNRNSGIGVTLIFQGPQGSGRLKAASALSGEIDAGLLVADVGGILAWQGQGGWQAAMERCFREADLQRAVLYWAGCERLNETGVEAQRAYFLRAAAEFGGLVILATTDVLDAAGVLHGKRLTHFDFPMPDLAMRERIWNAYLPDDAELARRLAKTFRLNEGQVKDAITAADSLARRRHLREPQITRADLYEGARQQAARRLVGLARQVDSVPDRSFDDLVLSPAVVRQIDELNQRINQRREVLERLGFERRLPLGKGLIVLFTGASGTGKTMTASLLAEAHGVSLFKVDMSALVSKWVGETEKNLSRLFDQAEYADAILFFDEADAIFGKRGEVKEAQDRWANTEVNYLLQRIEEFSGVVILTTNLRQNIDEAFLRRIHIIIDFPFPNEEEREMIWRRSLPVQPGVLVVENEDETLKTLAGMFRVTGGSIKNIVVDAAFRAYGDHSSGRNRFTPYDDEPAEQDDSAEVDNTPNPVVIMLRHLIASTAREFQKLGKPITQAEFGKTFYAWIKEDILAEGDEREKKQN